MPPLAHLRPGRGPVNGRGPAATAARPPAPPRRRPPPLRVGQPEGRAASRSISRTAVSTSGATGPPLASRLAKAMAPDAPSAARAPRSAPGRPRVRAQPRQHRDRDDRLQPKHDGPRAQGPPVVPDEPLARPASRRPVHVSVGRHEPRIAPPRTVPGTGVSRRVGLVPDPGGVAAGRVGAGRVGAGRVAAGPGEQAAQHAVPERPGRHRGRPSSRPAPGWATRAPPPSSDGGLTALPAAPVLGQGVPAAPRGSP